MTDWRDQILEEFAPQVSHLTLVSDPDCLLLEEKIQEGIRGRDFELITFDDPIQFRYAYESKYRSLWDKNQEIKTSVILRTANHDLVKLPYDLIKASRHLTFNLGHLFPNLSYPIVALLDLSDLDALFEAQDHFNPGMLGDNDTKDFILRHVFEIAPEILKHPADLVRFLIRRHIKNQKIPEALNERLIGVLVTPQPSDSNI